MLCLTALSVILSLFATVTGLVDDKGLPERRLPRYLEELVRGLKSDIVKNDLLDKLKALPHEEVERLHNVCCKGDGGCDVNAAAFLVRERGRFTQDDVGTFAVFFKSRFLDYIKKLENVPLDLSHPEHLDEAALLNGIGKWYGKAEYKVSDDKALKEAISYVIFSDESDGGRRDSAKILLRLVGRGGSKVLFDYWMEQPASRQLAVYINFLRDGKYGDLAILQPVIFNMKCIQSGDCTEEDYVKAFKIHAVFVNFNTCLKVFPLDVLFPEIVEILRKMTGRVPMSKEEALAAFSRDLGVESDLSRQGELVYQAATGSPYYPTDFADYVILDLNVHETWVALDHQIVQQSSDCTKFVGSYPYFPHERMAKYITAPYGTLGEYARLYCGAIEKVMMDVFRMDGTAASLNGSTQRITLSADNFWKLVDFLGANAEYRSFFAWMVTQAGYKLNTTQDRGALRGMEELIVDLVNFPDKMRRAAICGAAMLLIERDAGPDHPLFKDKFKLIRERIHRDDPFKLFDNELPIWASLSKYIFSVSTAAGAHDGFHDLQMAMVVWKLRGKGLHLKDEALHKVLGGYSSTQLENIYESAASTCRVVFRQPQLRKLLAFDSPVKETDLFSALQQLHRQAFSGRETAFGLILKYLIDGSDDEDLFTDVSKLVGEALRALPGNQDFSKESSECWSALEQYLYKSLKSFVVSKLAEKLGPELIKSNLGMAGLPVQNYKTFGELLAAAVNP